ncbi:MAG: hypothetical protein SGBAC_009826 [Bacillariaceae sp.]
MGWLSKLQHKPNGQRRQDNIPINEGSSSSITSANSMKKKPANDDRDNKEEALLRNVIRRIMLEEGEKLFEEEQRSESSVKTGAIGQVEKTVQMASDQPPPEEQALPQEATPPNLERSIQDVLNQEPDGGVSTPDDTPHTFIKPETVTNKQFDATVKQVFPGAMDNYSLIKQVASMLLETNGCTKSNTLLATSFCCDEASRQLEDDLEQTYGRNFNLGGLAGFPWAGETGFGAMAHHIPEDGQCVLVYGPHVGITKEGLVGKVERAGICKPDTCCGSAVAASNYVQAITDGRAMISTNLNSFTDFQQGAVQQMILPHCRRLDEANDRMLELPYALFESQDLLMTTIAEKGASSTPNGAILLGGIQINTGPTTPDYFHPLRFSYMNAEGRMVDDLLPAFCERSGSAHDPDGRVQKARKSVMIMKMGPSGRRGSDNDDMWRTSTSTRANTNTNTNTFAEIGKEMDREAEDEVSEMPTTTTAAGDAAAAVGISGSHRSACAQEPGGDHHRAPSMVTKSINMTGVLPSDIDM